MACCVLHNIALELYEPLYEDAEMAEIILTPTLPETIEEPSNQERAALRKEGFEKRDRIAKTLRNRLSFTWVGEVRPKGQQAYCGPYVSSVARARLCRPLI